jgi:DNA-binding beta-propeller fold protein YncE
VPPAAQGQAAAPPRNSRQVAVSQRLNSPSAAPRRCRLAPLATCLLTLTLTGCLDSTNPGEPELVWGKKGIARGSVVKPRAIAIDANDELYLVDMTGRIQVYDSGGNYLRGWRTPTTVNGRPTGLTIAKNGRLLVPDTHYYRVLVYEPDGRLVEEATLGGTAGRGPGEFGWVTDVVEDSAGNWYVSEYGDNDRIQKFSPEGEFLLQWGGHGEELGQFRRPQSMAVDDQDRIWVADACNHRIQVFDNQGKLVKHWGREGSAPGDLYYPYGIILDDEGHVYVCEYGNQRVQKFTTEGKSLATWGAPGHGPGQLHNPWAIAFDSEGRLHVLDSNNHRVQRVKF